MQMLQTLGAYSAAYNCDVLCSDELAAHTDYARNECDDAMRWVTILRWIVVQRSYVAKSGRRYQHMHPVRLAMSCMVATRVLCIHI
jgi:hypothetical protein